MSHAKAGLAAMIVLGGVVAAACEAGADATSMNANADYDAGTDVPSPSADAGGAGANASADLVPTDNAIILVHAAGFPAFRLCFTNYAKDQPTPTADLMPEANVVGVDVGSAIRLDPLPDLPNGGPRGVPGDVYAFREQSIRNAASGITCNDLLTGGLSDQAVKLGTIATPLDRGVHLLVVTGCDKNGVLGTYDTAQCGSDYDPNKGNLSIFERGLEGGIRASSQLPTEVVNLSVSLEQLRGAKQLSVTYGDLTAAGGATSTVTNPALDQVSLPLTPTPKLDPSDPSVYGKLGLTVSIDGIGTIAQQSLANIQQLSSPRDVPTTYYATASNYVLLLLGQPAVDATGKDAGLDDDVRKRLHFLAVPVVDPKPDAGADAGADGGDAGVTQ